MSSTPRHRFLEVHGLRGYLALEDPTLEQIRRLQLQISPARNVGTSVAEFRAILFQRKVEMEQQTNASNTDITLLWCTYSLTPNAGDYQTQTTVEGMITYQLLIGAAFINAIVWDLIVDEPFRGAGISKRLIEECHLRFRKIGVTRVHPLHSNKRGAIIRKQYLALGYSESPQHWLEYRLK